MSYPSSCLFEYCLYTDNSQIIVAVQNSLVSSSLYLTLLVECLIDISNLIHVKLNWSYFLQTSNFHRFSYFIQLMATLCIKNQPQLLTLFYNLCHKTLLARPSQYIQNWTISHHLYFYPDLKHCDPLPIFFRSLCKQAPCLWPCSTSLYSK